MPARRNARKAIDHPEDVEDLRILLREIFFKARGISRRRLGNFGLTPTQFLLLGALIRNDGASVGQLADDLGVSPSTASRILDRLESGQYLRRAMGRGDRRKIRVFLRPKGRRLRDKVRIFWSNMGREMFRDFTREERETLQDGLARVHENLMRVVEEEAGS
jgi:DNA-binding MarR family transcriptional regulator